MGFEIDLHGKDSIEATLKVENALFSLEQSGWYEYVDIIVGNGQGIIKHTVIDIIEQHGKRYEFPNPRQALIRVYKR
ncbi:Smr/MutS family protein [Mycoplasma enhydrae]|uniref:Smr/MutS family protein n=1 Tax=Mycoplasma enhydrae TaxID=2499220 RepID=UPI00197C0990|nr:Smr/MutS family protein [Mycoplasma enhydrae]MBN4089341.1 Smr/MutS family protein [Mycoplasma enhydrae]MCV3733713.1 Smr/MutS family protein [Mycoplasma enhydrae]